MVALVLHNSRNEEVEEHQLLWLRWQGNEPASFIVQKSLENE